MNFDREWRPAPLTRLVDTVGVLEYEALEALLHHPHHESLDLRLRLEFVLLRVHHLVGNFHDMLLEQLAALLERPMHEVLAIKVQQIKDEEAWLRIFESCRDREEEREGVGQQQK